MDFRLPEYAPFLNKVFKALENKGIDVSSYELDHLCYRTSSWDEYGKARLDFLSLGTLLTEAVVNGRPIASIELSEPISYEGRRVGIVEVPAPKAGSDYETGWEHVEFVINESFDEFLHKYSEQNFDLSQIYKANNPEIVLPFDGFVVKFHKESLREIIRKELE